MTPTTTTYRLVSRLPSQRKDRLFAEYESEVRANGQTWTTAAFYDYGSGRLQQSYMVDASVIARRVVEWARQPNCRVKFSHYES